MVAMAVFVVARVVLVLVQKDSTEPCTTSWWVQSLIAAAYYCTVAYIRYQLLTTSSNSNTRST